jgi:hypothetical protein
MPNFKFRRNGAFAFLFRSNLSHRSQASKQGKMADSTTTKKAQIEADVASVDSDEAQLVS